MNAHDAECDCDLCSQAAKANLSAYGIQIYRVGQAYPHAPAEQHHLFVVTANDGLYPNVDQLPLASTYWEAEEIAVSRLILGLPA